MPDDVRLTGNPPNTAETAAVVVAPGAPVVEAPVVVAAEVAPIAPAAIVAEPIVEAPKADVVVVPKTELTPEEQAAQPTLFKKFEQRKADEAKVVAEVKAESVKAEEAPKAEVKAEEAPVKEAAKEVAAEPVAIKWDFKLPDTVALSEPQTAELQGLLTSFHRDPDAKNQQALVDFHIARLNDFVTQYRKQAFQTFADVRARWTREVMADPFIGGSNHDLAMQAVADVRDAFVSRAKPGTKKYLADVAKFDDFLSKTGAGDHPAFISFVHNISQVLNEPELQATQEIAPIIQGPNNGRPSIYKHPTSLPRR